MPDYPPGKLKRFDVVLMEVSVNRYRTDFIDPEAKGELWKGSWDKVYWSTKLGLESVSLLVSADPSYSDDTFVRNSAINIPASPARARGIRIGI